MVALTATELFVIHVIPMQRFIVFNFIFILSFSPVPMCRAFPQKINGVMGFAMPFHFFLVLCSALNNNYYDVCLPLRRDVEQK